MMGMTENKRCSSCKYFQIDGMFGLWCDKRHNWKNNTNANCSDWESKK